MTDYDASDREVSRAIRSWLHEDRHEDVSRVAGAVLDQVEAAPQRHATWWPARRTPIMNKILGYGVAAAAVIVALIVGMQLVGSPDSGGFGAGPSVSASAVPTPEPTPSPSVDSVIPAGSSFTLSDEVPLYVTIPGPGWEQPDGGILAKADDALVITGWIGADPIVPGDPCNWASTMPDGPATTLDEIADALGNQATRDASEPVDVSVDGFPGKAITLHVPDAPFTDCDEGKFCTLSFGDGAGCNMWYHEPSAIDELWVVDRDGQFTFTAGMYYADTPADTVEEIRAILSSMSFGE